MLLGSGRGSLGTNDIYIGPSAALETTYDINSPDATLTLDGQMFLHQNDRFKNVIVAGIPLSVGVHSFAELTAAYPTIFPATWPVQIGSGVTGGSGSLIVGLAPPPQVSVQTQFTAGKLTLSLSQGILLEAGEITGPWQTNNTAASPFTVTPSEARKFYRVLVQ